VLSVLLFQKRFLEGLVDGSITLTFRQWVRPQVKPGGRYRVHPIGVVDVERLKRVRVQEISASDARRAGFSSREELLEYMRPAAGRPLTKNSEVFRVELHYAGDGDRVPIALDENLSPADVKEIDERLNRFDKKEPWTRKTLALIKQHPRVAASQLAAILGRETAPFKAEVVKLKKLGLTQSFEVGYELSPRGEQYLRRSKPRG
jgi:hypothetical protein